jgi:hypothetical protein
MLLFKLKRREACPTHVVIHPTHHSTNIIFTPFLGAEFSNEELAVVGKTTFDDGTSLFNLTVTIVSRCLLAIEYIRSGEVYTLEEHDRI